MTATDINFVLGKLFTALAQNRIPPRNASILAHIGHLLLHSLRDVKNEYKFHYEFDSWEKMLNRAVPLSNSSPARVPADSDDSHNHSDDSPAHTSAGSSDDPSACARAPSSVS